MPERVMKAAEAAVLYREELLPALHESHGTPHAMVRRTIQFELPRGHAGWEQTDYGHPGRFNAWEPRRIDTKLQANVEELRTIAEALSALVERGAE